MKQTSLLRNKHVQVCAALIAADCLLFGLVDPTSANAVWLGVGYVLLGATLLGFASLLARSVRDYGERPYKIVKRFLRYGVVAAIIMVGLQSVGQLTPKDVVTLMPLMVIAYWYFGYGKKNALRSGLESP